MGNGMKKTPAQKLRDYLKRKYGGTMKEKKTTTETFPSKKKQTTMPNYGGALGLRDLRKVQDGKKTKTNS
tara:strand:- start:260 stop:469 length:210 start_codon:yes stop_codon:yes gene_type:complete